MDKNNFEINNLKENSMKTVTETKEKLLEVGSIGYWYSTVVNNLNPEKWTSKDLEILMIKALKLEKPNRISALMERKCNLQCLHCLCPIEKSSKEYSKYLEKSILNTMKQLPENPMFIHEGRTLSPWHLDIFEKIQEERKDAEIGMIDNGSYTNLLNDFLKRNIKLDHLDISIDGIEESHNNQRDPYRRKSYETAIRGIENAHLVLKEGGRLSSLMTLTDLNFQDIGETADFLLTKDEKGHSKVDEFYVSIMNPIKDENSKIEMNLDQFKQAWEQIKKVNEKWNKDRDITEHRLFFPLYRIEDLKNLSEVVGKEKMKKAFNTLEGNGEIKTGKGYVHFEIDGVGITYYPSSIWPSESIFLDADGAQRLPYAQTNTLDQLHKNPELDKYTVNKLKGDEKFDDMYENQVNKYWENFGKNCLKKEIEFFESLKG